jgi:hypothetical protein
MDPLLGKRVCYVQFSQRFDDINSSDQYANHTNTFADVSKLFSQAQKNINLSLYL